MALLNEAVEAKKFDTRMVERNIARGVIPKSEHEKSVASLPDDADNAEYISIDSLIQSDGESTSPTQH